MSQPDFDTAALQRIVAPWGDCAPVERVLASAWQVRQRNVAATGLIVLQHHAGIAADAGFPGAFARFQALDPVRRRALLESPALRAWLWLMTGLRILDTASSQDEGRLARYLREFARLVAEGDGEVVPDEPRYNIQRFDVDPIVREVAPPSYSFDDLDGKRARDARSGYTLPFFADTAAAALHEIGRVWPEMARIFPWFVKTIIHLPELEYRSCSAQRYAGAIFISANDDCLMALEESLVHECGHQILYCLMEATPLVQGGGRHAFRLPWSGAERDAYGYFHATYIYVLLAIYMERARTAALVGNDVAQQRFGEVVDGLRTALIDLEDAEFLTPAGLDFMRALTRVARALIAIRDRETYGAKRAGATA